MTSRSDWNAPPDRSPLSDEIGRRAPGRKDTKRWCKGKVGREHQPEVVLHAWYGYRECEIREFINHYTGEAMRHRVCRHVVRCAACEKILNHWLSEDECPILSPGARP